jgi:hypothetical protein
MQTQGLRSAGLCRVSVLLEVSPSETPQERHHMDGATTTNEGELYEHMFEEQAFGFDFVETPDQERTALWLVAMRSVLCARLLVTSAASGDGQPVSWTSIVAKPAQERERERETSHRFSIDKLYRCVNLESTFESLEKESERVYGGSASLLDGESERERERERERESPKRGSGK